MELIEHFFFNLSLLIVLLFFSMLWVERAESLRTIQIIATVYIIASLLLCFVFTHRIEGHDVILDLRKIPFIIGGLYIGLGPLLASLTIIVRSFYGIDTGFWLTIFFYGSLAILFWRISPWFLKLSSKKRILFSVSVSFLFSFVQSFPLGFADMNQFDVWFSYLFIQPLGVGVIAYFIEEIYKTIQLRLHVVKLKRLETVEQMGAAICHEIRNPLTAAIGFVQLLQDESISRESRVQYISILRNELKSAEQVIQNYLTFSKPEIELVEPLIVHEELQQIIQSLQVLANRNSVHIITNYSYTGAIEGDSQKFHQCFVNIMKNAIEAMPNGGVLTVETMSTSSNMTILVQDTGAGMTAEQLNRLGEPYYSTKGEKGTGLGIMVVYSIVHAMNGRIHVESELGVGTRFEFTFPSSPTLFEQNEIHKNMSVLVMSG
ncbi:sensor histidine kinase [Psychrobacillus vulpis]|uniref:histidine kinase n=1 Tax=Psychrobacillus vulpis TaxID=2325572 RepID=A0A544TSB3_9BACI|nr:HAMP domain-containing sensor histidine kinase [Psychrobacillus vulpis]TQR20335.1 sensor histidine kinase [Psychrobacillus vulpis]